MQAARSQDPASPAGEAARYAVLQRLGPALKHDLVVNLQAVAMMAEVVGARLDKGPPVPADLPQQVGRIHRMAREAVANSLKVAAWLTPPAADEGIGLREGIEECLSLVRSNFGFRGFSLRAQLEFDEAGLEVSHAPLRLLLLAGLIRLSDEADEAAELRVRAQVASGAATLTLERLAAPGAVASGGEGLGYRRLTDADVQALARDAAVDLNLAPGCIALRLPRLVANSALKIAPL